jgi:hypothetical protein
MTITRWPARRWIAAVLGAAAVAVLVGVPTGVVPTPFYTRMTPVLWWNYPVWAVTALLGGLLVATFVRPPQVGAAPTTSLTGGGLLSAFAVGCPVCNKLVVALVGFSGALNLWAPIQPVLGVASVALLGWALWRRLATEAACPVRVGATT